MPPFTLWTALTIVYTNDTYSLYLKDIWSIAKIKTVSLYLAYIYKFENPVTFLFMNNGTNPTSGNKLLYPVHVSCTRRLVKGGVRFVVSTILVFMFLGFGGLGRDCFVTTGDFSFSENHYNRYILYTSILYFYTISPTTGLKTFLECAFRNSDGGLSFTPAQPIVRWQFLFKYTSIF